MLDLRAVFDEVTIVCRELADIDFSVETVSVGGEVFWLATFRRHTDLARWRCKHVDVKDAVAGALDKLRKGGLVWGDDTN